MALNVHVYPSPLAHESRMLRITAALAASGTFQTIEMAGTGLNRQAERIRLDQHRTAVKFYAGKGSQNVSNLVKMLRLLTWSLRVLRYLRTVSPACVNAHSLSVLPLCAAAAGLRGTHLVYEPHELETESIASRGLRRSLARVVERLLIRRCDAVIVVSDSIADWYLTRYQIARPVVIRNYPAAEFRSGEDIAALRRRLGLRENALTFIYQGAMMEGRGIRRLLSAFSRIPDIDLLLLGDGPLTPMIKLAGKQHSNIIHHPAVAPEAVRDYTRCAHAGLCLTEAACLSYEYSLPNKLFEYIAAGLPVIVSDLPEQARFTNTYRCGWIAPDDDQALQEMIRSLDPSAFARVRPGVLNAARECSWHAEAARLTEVYKALLNG